MITEEEVKEVDRRFMEDLKHSSLLRLDIFSFSRKNEIEYDCRSSVSVHLAIS